MNNQLKYLIGSIWMAILLLLGFISCTEQEIGYTGNPNAPAPAQVINPTWVSTNGGALISYTLPEDKNLLFVKAVYVNSLGNKVFRSSSQYVNQIDIDGFIDMKPHEVELISVGHNGKESKAIKITIVPDVSYIHLIQQNIVVNKIMGGISATWHNPSKKTVFLYVEYTNEENNTQIGERIYASEIENGSFKLRGLDTIPYSVKIIVEDFSGNKTDKEYKGTFTPDPEQKIDKSTWKIVTGLSCIGEKYEGKLVYFFDDVIDVIEKGGRLDQDPNGNNSYFIIHKDENGDPLQFLDGSTTNNQPLLIVIDMGKNIILSRLVVWQRAFEYDSNNANSTMNDKYHYYKDDNMRAFYAYGATESDIAGATKRSLAAKIWEHPLIKCDIGDPRDTDGNVPAAKIQEAIDGHEWELPNLSEPFRYLVIGITQTFGSATQICCSEITLYGQDNVITIEPENPEE